MAKNKNAKDMKPGTFEGPEWERLRNLSAPADFKKRTSDAIGYWIPKLTPIMCIPLNVKLMDSRLDPNRPAVLIIAELTKPCALSVKEENMDEDMETLQAEKGEIVVGKPGDIIGIWGKPGMKDIIPLGGVEVFMQMNPENKWKKIKNRPSKMVTFDIKSGKVGSKLVIVSDQRDKSKGAKAWIEEGSTATNMSGASDATSFNYGANSADGTGDDDPAADRL